MKTGGEWFKSDSQVGGLRREVGSIGVYQRGRRLLSIAILFSFLIPCQVNAWWIFGPSNYDDCILKYQKEAKCKVASFWINISCECKFKPEHDPLSLYGRCNYNADVYDCILDNIGGAQNDQAAGAIARSCISKYNRYPAGLDFDPHKPHSKEGSYPGGLDFDPYK